MPNRNPVIAGLVLALILLGGLGGYSLGRGHADARALEANRRADSLAVVIAEFRPTIDATLAGNRIVVDSATKVVAKAGPAKARVRAVDVAAVPDTCRPVVQTILAAADTVFVADSSAIAMHEAANARLADKLEKAEVKLGVAERELAKQAKRTEREPRKLLGFIPPPTLTAGVGTTYDPGDKRLHVGPTATLGWKVTL